MPRKTNKIDRDAIAQLVYVYLRVSTEKQRKDGKGLDAQLADCQGICERLGLTIFKVVIDPGLSGKLPYQSRPALAEALEGCAAGLAGGIVAYNQDRYARGMAAFEGVRDFAIKHKIFLLAGDQDITTEDNDIPSEALAFVASVERKLIVRRMRGGRIQRAEVDGRGTAPVPYGFAIDLTQDQNGSTIQTIIINPDTAPIVQTVLRLVKGEKRSYRYAAEFLNSQGIKSPYAGRVRLKGTKKGIAFSGRWSVGQVQKIVENYELYTTGRKQWNGIEGEQRWPILFNGEIENIHG